jgi:outer membrane receptor for ferrienterochelin and colicins
LAHFETNGEEGEMLRRVSLAVVLFGMAGAWFHGLVAAAATPGSIVGKVVDAKTGQPLACVNVVVSGTMRGAASDEAGVFRIGRLDPGVYVLRASMVGYETATLQVEVRQGAVEEVEFRLEPSILQAQQIVVTATRSEHLLEDVPVVMEVVQQYEIREKGANDLAEALEDRPGVVIDASSSGGKILRMNGVDGRRILVLVDGVPVAGKVNDRQELDLFDADDIERIEIVKGPGSSLYGSDAMGGVVNVITQPITEDFRLDLRTRTGGFGLRGGNLALSGTTAGLGYALSLDHTRQGERRSTSEIAVKDFRSSHGRAKLQRRWKSGSLTGSVLYRRTSQEATLQMSGRTYDTETNVRHWDYSMHLLQAMASRVEADVTFFGSRNFREYRSVPRGRPASVDTTTEDLFGIRSDLRWTLKPWLMADVGYDMSANQYESDRVSSASTRWQHGLFTQLQLTPLEPLTLVAGARYDKISGLQGRVSPRASAVYSIAPGLKLRTGWGMGFRAPSFIEMYSYFVMPIPGRPLYLIGNEDLKPETSSGYDVGLEYSLKGRLFANVSFFENRFRDLIADYWRQPGSVLSYRNVNRASFRTLEAQGKLYLLSNFWLTVSYNYTRVWEDEEYPTLGISPHMATLRLNWRMLHDRLNLSARSQLFSSTDVTQYVTDASGALVPRTLRRNAYGLLDATLTLRLHRLVDLRLGVSNLTDYTDATFGPYLGRRAYVDLDFSL